jgi:hypothetical protein
MRGAIDQLNAGGIRLGGTYYRGLLADSLLHLGRTEEAASVLEEAIALAAAGPERFWEPELHRLRACVLERQYARESLSRAIDESRTHGLRSLELRALTHQFRLLGDEASRAELAQCLAGFEETNPTRDVADALDAIGGS